jgi:choline dehydrogenase-like flavoprotein
MPLKNNFLGMFRPSREEFDALEKLGNKGWNWESLLGYMKKVCNATIKFDIY